MADIILKTKIPDKNYYKQRVIDAVSGLATVPMILKIKDGLEIELEYAVKQSGETNEQFGERWLRTLGKSQVKLFELLKDYQRYEAEQGVLVPPSESVPEDILE